MGLYEHTKRDSSITVINNGMSIKTTGNDIYQGNSTMIKTTLIVERCLNKF